MEIYFCNKFRNDKYRLYYEISSKIVNNYLGYTNTLIGIVYNDRTIRNFVIRYTSNYKDLLKKIKESLISKNISILILSDFDEYKNSFVTEATNYSGYIFYAKTNNKNEIEKLLSSIPNNRIGLAIPEFFIYNKSNNECYYFNKENTYHITHGKFFSKLRKQESIIFASEKPKKKPKNKLNNSLYPGYLYSLQYSTSLVILNKVAIVGQNTTQILKPSYEEVKAFNCANAIPMSCTPLPPTTEQKYKYGTVLQEYKPPICKFCNQTGQQLISMATSKNGKIHICNECLAETFSKN